MRHGMAAAVRRVHDGWQAARACVPHTASLPFPPGGLRPFRFVEDFDGVLLSYDNVKILTDKVRGRRFAGGAPRTGVVVHTSGRT